MCFLWNCFSDDCRLFRNRRGGLSRAMWQLLCMDERRARRVTPQSLYLPHQKALFSTQVHRPVGQPLTQGAHDCLSQRFTQQCHSETKTALEKWKFMWAETFPVKWYSLSTQSSVLGLSLTANPCLQEKRCFPTGFNVGVVNFSAQIFGILPLCLRVLVPVAAIE